MFSNEVGKGRNIHQIALVGEGEALTAKKKKEKKRSICLKGRRKNSKGKNHTQISKTRSSQGGVSASSTSGGEKEKRLRRGGRRKNGLGNSLAGVEGALWGEEKKSTV